MVFILSYLSKKLKWTPGLQVTTKTVAQCVEFYYSFKKQVKIGRSGTLVYGVAEPPESRTAAEEVDLKVRRSEYSKHPCFLKKTKG